VKKEGEKCRGKSGHESDDTVVAFRQFLRGETDYADNEHETKSPKIQEASSWLFMR